MFFVQQNPRSTETASSNWIFTFSLKSISNTWDHKTPIFGYFRSVILASAITLKTLNEVYVNTSVLKYTSTI